MCSVVSNSLWPHGLKLASFLCPWNFPGKNTKVGCHFLLQGFDIQTNVIVMTYWHLTFKLMILTCRTVILNPLPLTCSSTDNHHWSKPKLLRNMSHSSGEVGQKELGQKKSWVLLPCTSSPGGSDGKESTCNAGDLCSIPGLGRSLGEGNGYPL